MNPKASQQRSRKLDQAVRVSAIVVTRFTGQPLELCLRTLLAEPWIDELVIVDNGNPLAVSSALRGLRADRRDVALVQGRPAAGLAAAWNTGAALARGRWLLFVDPTVVLQRGAVERLVAAGGGAPSPWISGGRLTDNLGREEAAARAAPLSAWAAAALASGAARAAQAPLRAMAAAPIPVASVSAAFMLIPRADFAALGGFDEAYVSDCGDLDLCRRVSDAGGAVLLQPSAAAVKFPPSRRVRAERREAQGLARFAAKHARTPAQRVFAAVAPMAMGPLFLLRALRRALARRRTQRR